MKLHAVTLSVNDLQDAMREYMKTRTESLPEIVQVDNGYGRIVVTIPLYPQAVIRGEAFMRRTE